MIHDFALDGTQFTVSCKGMPAQSQEVLAWHSQMTWKPAGQSERKSCPVVHSRVLDINSASCMWTALTSSATSLQPVLPATAATLRGTIIAHDGAGQNHLGYHHMMALNRHDDDSFVGSDPCLQHKTSNVLKPATQQGWLACNVFCLSKVLNHGHTYREVLRQVENRLHQSLEIVGAEYHQSRADRAYAESLLELCFYRINSNERSDGDPDRSPDQIAHQVQARKQLGAKLIRMLPGDWRQGAAARSSGPTCVPSKLSFLSSAEAIM